MTRVMLWSCIILFALYTAATAAQSDHHKPTALRKLSNGMQLTPLSNVTHTLNIPDSFNQTSSANRTLMHAVATLPELSEFSTLVGSSERFRTMFADPSVSLTLFVPVNEDVQLTSDWRTYTNYTEGKQYIDYTLSYHVYPLGALDIGTLPVDTPVAIRSLAAGNDSRNLSILLYHSRGRMQVNCAKTVAQPIQLSNGVLVPISRALNPVTEGKATLAILEQGTQVNCSAITA